MTFNDIYNDKDLLKFIQSYSYNKYASSKLRYDMEYDDFLQLCYINIDKYVTGFDNKKSKLTTYLGSIINSTFLMENRRIQQKCRHIDTTLNSVFIDDKNLDSKNNFDDIIPSNFSLDDEYNRSTLLSVIDKCYKSLNSDLDKEILSMLYDGYKVTHIKNKLNLKSRTSVYQSMDRIRKVLIKYL